MCTVRIGCEMVHSENDKSARSAPTLPHSQTIDFGFMFSFSSRQDPVMQHLALHPSSQQCDAIIVANGMHGIAKCGHNDVQKSRRSRF